MNSSNSFHKLAFWVAGICTAIASTQCHGLDYPWDIVNQKIKSLEAGESNETAVSVVGSGDPRPTDQSDGDKVRWFLPEDVAIIDQTIRATISVEEFYHAPAPRQVEMNWVVETEIAAFPSTIRGRVLSDFERKAKAQRLANNLIAVGKAPYFAVQEPERLREQFKELAEVLGDAVVKINPGNPAASKEVCCEELLASWLRASGRTYEPVFKAPLSKSRFDQLVQEVRAKTASIIQNTSAKSPLQGNLQDKAPQPTPTTEAELAAAKQRSTFASKIVYMKSIGAFSGVFDTIRKAYSDEAGYKEMCVEMEKQGLTAARLAQSQADMSQLFQIENQAQAEVRQLENETAQREWEEKVKQNNVSPPVPTIPDGWYEKRPFFILNVCLLIVAILFYLYTKFLR